MPTATKPKFSAATAAQRASDVLQLADAKRLGIALAEAAAEEVSRNPRFAQRVREFYDLLTPAPVKTKASPPVQLIPIRHVEGHEITASGKLDPYFLYEAYGAHQLRDALFPYPKIKLQEGAEAVEKRNPGTKANRRSKDTIIEYIIQHVVN